MKKTSQKTTMERAMNDSKNKGYHLVVAAGKLFRAKTGAMAARILREVRKKYPQEVPTVAYLPKAQSLILWF